MWIFEAGIKAVRECTPKALVTLHLESMGYGKCSEIMNAWERNGVDYDVFGSSFYQFWQGNSSKNALAGTSENRKSCQVKRKNVCGYGNKLA